jgi:site-specific DNA recombinase
MANPEFFRQEFYSLATDGFIGDPNGELSFGYMRVSSKGQAEEGKSGLPRQIEHIHMKALEEHYKLSWDMIFADDHTGFEFEDRPQLQILLKEIRSNKKRANALIIENIDRLSRNADWHQGYLLDQFKNNNVKVFAFKDIGNRITRMVLGAAAQDTMEEAKDRMRLGSLKKLKSGRITAKRPAYGFQIVDSNGEVTAKARSDSHYGIYEPHALVVRLIFNSIAEGNSLKKTCEVLEGLYPPPKKAKHWEPVEISKMIKNTVYKGIYVGNKYTFIKQPNRNNGDLLQRNRKKVMKKIIRPEEEWIYVSVPKIVSDDLWQGANNMLNKNAIMSKRNGSGKFLLTGLIKCASCGRTYAGGSKKSRNRITVISYYRCASYARPKVIRDLENCRQISIPSKEFDNDIWILICKLMTDPKPLLNALEKVYSNDDNNQTKAEMKYLSTQIEACDYEDRRVRQGFNSGLYTDEEAKEEREIIKVKKEKHQATLNKLKTKLLTYEQYLSQKNTILAITKSFQTKEIGENTPFHERGPLVKMVIEKIILNTIEKKFEIFGIINGSWSFSDDIEVVNEQENGNIELASMNRYLCNIEWKVQYYLDKTLGMELSIVSSSLGGNIERHSPASVAI